MFYELLNALEETLFMIFAAGLLTWVIGLPLGTLLSITASEKFLDNPYFYKPLAGLLNITRSIPYIALMIAVIPFTRFIAGSIDGCVAAVVPLTLASIPYFAQLCEKAINKIEPGLIKAARMAGASPLQIIYKILIPEALPAIIKSFTIILTHLVGYSTIAGTLGAGGLGTLMIQNGYQTFHADYVVSAMVLLVVLIKMIQSCGDYIVHGTLHKNPST